MSTLRKTPLLLPLLAYVAGTFIGKSVIINNAILWVGLLIGIGLYIVMLGKRYRGRRHIANILSLLSLSVIVMAGWLRRQQVDPSADPNHLVHHIDNVEYYAGRITRASRMREKVTNAIVHVEQGRINGEWRPLSGKVAITWPTTTPWATDIGSQVVVKGKPKLLIDDQNGYRHMLMQRGITHQHFVEAGMTIGKSTLPWIWSLLRISREWIYNRLKIYLEEPETVGLVQALILGEKSDLSPRIRRYFQDVGASHLLAISGLHMGFLYLLIMLLLRLLSMLFSWRKERPWLGLWAVWGYAALAGGTPSVLRAALICSLVAWGKSVDRKYSWNNLLYGSALMLLVVDPIMIHRLSFQLSFLAVWSICNLAPLLGMRMPFRTPWLRSAWKATVISCSVQIGTAPLVLYYFHEFPTYFLLSSWVIIPLASVILYCSVFLVTCGSVLPIRIVLVGILILLKRFLIFYMNKIVSLPNSHLGPYYPSWGMVALTYALLFIGCWAANRWLEHRTHIHAKKGTWDSLSMLQKRTGAL